MAVMAQLRSRLDHHVSVAPRQFPNPAVIAPFDGVFVDQIPADAESGSAREDIIGGVLLIYAARGDEGDLRERRFQCFDVAGAAHLSAGKNLDEVRTGFRGRDDVGGSQGSRKNQYFLLNGKLDDLGIETWAGYEERAGVHAFARPGQV